MSTELDAFAQREVDRAHHAARNEADPVAFLRRQQEEAEVAWFRSGSQRDLAVVRAFHRSLDGTGKECDHRSRGVWG